MKATDGMTQRWDRKQKNKPKNPGKTKASRSIEEMECVLSETLQVPLAAVERMKSIWNNNGLPVPPPFVPSVKPTNVAECPYYLYCGFCGAKDSLWDYVYKEDLWGVHDMAPCCIECCGAIKKQGKEIAEAYLDTFLRLCYEYIVEHGLDERLRIHVMSMVLGKQET